MGGLDKVVEKLNSQKSKKGVIPTKKKPIEVPEEEEEEQETEESEEEEDLEDDDLDEDIAEDPEEEDVPKPSIEKKKTVSTPSLSEDQQKVLKRRNEEINLLHNTGLYRYELLSQLITLNENFQKFFKALRGEKDGKE